MRNLCSFVMGAVAFLFCISAASILLSLLNSSIHLWIFLNLFIYGAVNYLCFKTAFIVVLSISKSKWPMLFFHAFAFLVFCLLIVLYFIYNGFSLFFLIVYGSLAFTALGSFFKCLEADIDINSNFKFLIFGVGVFIITIILSALIINLKYNFIDYIF